MKLPPLQAGNSSVVSLAEALAENMGARFCPWRTAPRHRVRLPPISQSMLSERCARSWPSSVIYAQAITTRLAYRPVPPVQLFAYNQPNSSALPRTFYNGEQSKYVSGYRRALICQLQQNHLCRNNEQCGVDGKYRFPEPGGCGCCPVSSSMEVSMPGICMPSKASLFQVHSMTRYAFSALLLSVWCCVPPPILCVVASCGTYLGKRKTGCGCIYG